MNKLITYIAVVIIFLDFSGCRSKISEYKGTSDEQLNNIDGDSVSEENISENDICSVAEAYQPYLCLDENSSQGLEADDLYALSQGCIKTFRYDQNSRLCSTGITGEFFPKGNVIDAAFSQDTQAMYVIYEDKPVIAAFEYLEDGSFKFSCLICNLMADSISLKQIEILKNTREILVLDSNQHRVLSFKDELSYQTCPQRIIDNISSNFAVNERMELMYTLSNDSILISEMNGSQISSVSSHIETDNCTNLSGIIFDEERNVIIAAGTDENGSCFCLIKLTSKGSQAEQMITVSGGDLNFNAVSEIFLIGADTIGLQYNMPSSRMLFLDISDLDNIIELERKYLSDNFNGQMFYIGADREIFLFTNWAADQIVFYQERNFNNPYFSFSQESSFLDWVDIAVEKDTGRIFVLSVKGMIHVFESTESGELNLAGSITGDYLLQPYHMVLDSENDYVFVLNKPFRKSAYVTGYSSSHFGFSSEVFHWEGRHTGFLHNLMRDLAIDTVHKEIFVSINDNNINSFSYDRAVYRRVGDYPVRSLNGENTQLLHPICIAVDYEEDTLWILNHPAGYYYITVYPRDAEGDYPPVRTIECEGWIDGAYQMMINTESNQVVITNWKKRVITIFDKTDQSFSDPVQVISGDSAEFSDYFQIDIAGNN